ANRYLGTRWQDYVDNAKETIDSIRVTQPHWVVDHMVDTADCLFLMGRWEEADEMVEAAQREDPTRSEPVGVPELHIARGEFDQARALIRASAEPSAIVDIEAQVREFVFSAEIAAWEGNWEQ